MRKTPVDYRSLGPDVFVRRSELAVCIAQRHGVKFSSSRFDKFPTEGGGPQFTILGRVAMYRIAWVDTWFESEVKRKLRRPHSPSTPEL